MSQRPPARSATAWAPVNIALIKHWGYRDASGDLPARPSLSLTLEGLDLKFDANDDYTRVSLDHKGTVDRVFPRGNIRLLLRLNGRTRPHYHHALCNRGGILITDSLRAENHDDDSFGQFTYRNYFGAHSKWTRQTVLTKEGYLIVRDLYEPGTDVDGYQAASCWLLKAQGDAPRGDRNWYDAPAWDHAWWQKQKKRVLLYMHPGEGLTFGRMQHAASQDIGGTVDNSFAKATVKAGIPQVWLSVLMPFNEGAHAAAVAKKIRTAVDGKGNTRAEIGSVKVSIAADGLWNVKR